MDINLVQHAKDYIDDLAKGVNPLSKQAVPDDEIINNVKISRCLFYVSDILNEVIKNGGLGKKSRANLDDFDVSAIDFDKFNYSQRAITISVIVRNINELKPETMKKLKVTAITNWLVDIGMLHIVQVNGKNHKRPTAEGIAIGLTQTEKQGQYGTYFAVEYDLSAQHFIIDNINAVIDGGYNNRSSKLNEE